MGRAEDLFERLHSGGTQYLHELFASAKSEESFLEFKKSGDNGAGAVLHADDRRNLIRALSGFANSDGGVVVWGVGRDRSSGADAPTPVPLADCRAFCARIDDQISGCTVPPVPGARSEPIPAAPGSAEGFVATLIPASPVAPHQTIDPKGYLIRAGSNFQPVTHNVLAGMFGRSPRPRIRLSFASFVPEVGQHLGGWYVKAAMAPVLVNVGSVVAEDAYVTWSLRTPQTGCKVVVANSAESNLSRWQIDSMSESRVGSCLAIPATRIAPNSRHVTVKLVFTIQGPCQGFEMTFTYGCKGSPAETLTIAATAEDQADEFERACRQNMNIAFHGKLARRTSERMLGLTKIDDWA